MKKCVVVTGAAGGIGQALVRGFTDAGHAVIGIDVNAGNADLQCEHWLACDLQAVVADAGMLSALADELRTIFAERPLLALVNNAAIQVVQGTDQLTRQDWQRSLDVNVLAPFFLSQALLPDLEAAHGSILNIGSIHAHLTKPGFVAYATSKAALGGLTRAMAVDLGKRVRVNAIEPAAIETSMLRNGFEGNPAGYRDLQDYHPLGRIGRAEEVANLALAIVAGGMDFVHGACLGMDGGIRARLFDPD